MGSIREQVLGVGRWALETTWRVAIFLLSWQARYFVEEPSVQGLSWEQGRLSFYVSWMPMLVTIGWVLWLDLKSKTPLRLPLLKGEGLRKMMWLLIGILLFLLPFFFSSYPRASLQWLVQAGLLLAFGWALFRLQVGWRRLAVWFVLSLVPHALLGLWQYADQFVYGSKWLGMATQDPLTKGVSVIESGGRRVLRAYGGFPHPNIFGGWLAAGLLVLSSLFIQAKKRWECAVWSLLSVVFSIVLVLTFSRSAWFTAMLGLALSTCLFFFRIQEKRRRLFVFLGALLLVVSATGYSVRELILPRLSIVGRLEAKSIDERAQGWTEGWRFFWEHPFVGTGIGTYNKVHETLVPPHNVWLLALNEIGIVGLLGVLLLFGFAAWKAYRKKILFSAFFLSALQTFFILSLFDYYLWSFWSGLGLAFFMFTLSSASAHDQLTEAQLSVT
jgi:O-antigen ligase